MPSDRDDRDRPGGAVDRDGGALGDPIGRTVHLMLTVAESEAALGPVVERVAAQSGRAVETYLAGSQAVAGTPEQVTERLAAYQEAGAVHVTGYFADTVWGDSLEVFAAEVMPHLR